jgi:hypothetical protein
MSFEKESRLFYFKGCHQEPLTNLELGSKLNKTAFLIGSRTEQLAPH